MTTIMVKLLVWVRLLYQRTNTLIRLCLSNLLDTISYQYQSYVIWVCLYCFLLRVVLCFCRTTIPSSSKGFAREISTLLISLRGLLYPPASWQKFRQAGYGIEDLAMLECEIFKC